MNKTAIESIVTDVTECDTPEEQHSLATFSSQFKTHTYLTKLTQVAISHLLFRSCDLKYISQHKQNMQKECLMTELRD